MLTAAQNASAMFSSFTLKFQCDLFVRLLSIFIFVYYFSFHKQCYRVRRVKLLLIIEGASSSTRCRDSG